MAKTAKKLPDVLSGEEVLRVLRAFDSLKHKTIAILCCGAGLRINEALHLKVKDIDSARGLIHVRQVVSISSPLGLLGKSEGTFLG